MKWSSQRIDPLEPCLSTTSAVAILRVLSLRYWRVPLRYVWLVALVNVACLPTPPPEPGQDTGVVGPVDAGWPEAGPARDAGIADAGQQDAAPLCGPQTVLFGPDCPEEGCRYGDSCGETGCGTFLCAQDGTLQCFYDEANLCGGCGEVDTSAGMPGSVCGEYQCGSIVCNADQDATLCVGDHPLNICGGCSLQIDPVGLPCIDDLDCGDQSACVQDPNAPLSGRFCAPGGPCSSQFDQCGTGETRCSRDGERFICFRGRSPTSCGGCDRCILYQAEMDQRFGGNYIRIGTRAVIENVQRNPSRNVLVFDPLRLGDGADALPNATVYLLNEDEQGFVLGTFARAADGRLPDYIESYEIPDNDFSQGTWYVSIHDSILGMISQGRLVVEEGPQDP